MTRLITVMLLALVFALGSLAQDAGKNLTTGVVKDDAGEPIIGATVRVKGTNMATITDIDGHFSLEARTGSILEIAYIGYKNIEVKATPKVNVVMRDDFQQLEDVVVIGYGTAKRSDISGAVASVDTKAMLKKSPTNVNSMLQGAVAGVYVSNGSGAPNASPSVRIRGVATINNSADPLYVVDGVQMGTNISYLNPADIENIEVLKDASATAIYGAQGANGVIMVTTKKGTKGAAHVDASAEFGVQSLSSKLETMDVDDYAKAIRQARANDNAVLVMPIWDASYDGQRQNIDWQDEMTRNAIRQNYNVSVSGGNDKLQGIFSSRYLKHDGLVVNSSYDKMNIRAAFKADLGKVVELGGETNMTHSNTRNINGNLRSFALLTPSMDYTDDNDMLIQPRLVNSDGTYGTFWQYSGKSEIGASRDNIYASQMEADDHSQTTVVNSNINLGINILKGLKFRVIYSYSSSNTDSNNYTVERKRYNDVYDDNGVLSSQPVWMVSQTTSNKLNMTKSNSYTHALEDYLTYTWSSADHDLSMMLGNSVISNNGSWNGAVSGDFPFETIRNISLTSDNDSKEASGAFNLSSRSISYYGRVMYGFKSRYNLTASLRRDGSSHFARGNRWDFFPSFAASWRISEEPFMKQFPMISNMKLRLGWGRTGNSGNPTDYIIPQLSSENVRYKFYTDNSSSQAPVESVGMAQVSLVDTNLRWETNTQTNFGLDFSLWNGDLSVSLDYFIRTTTDLLINKVVRPSTGFQRVYSNFGEIENRGLEFSVAYNKRLDKDWHVGVQLTGSTIKNKIVECGRDILNNYGFNQGMHWSNTSLCRNGYAIGSWYGYRTDGIFRSQEEIDALNESAKANGFTSYQSGAQPGDIKFVDVNGDGTITDEDLDVIGDGFPKLNLGLNLSAQYKNFDFSMNCYGVLGQDILSYSAMSMTLMTSSDSYVPNILKSEYQKAWSTENPNGENPRLSINDANWNMRCSDFWIRNGNFLKISNLQVGYTLPRSVVENVQMSGARVYLAVNNLCTISPYNKYGDPELGGSILYQGLDAGHYPSPRTFVIGANIQF